MGHSAANYYNIAGMKVRRDGSSEEKGQRRKTYCAHRALTSTLKKERWGRSVTFFYEKKRADIETVFLHVFTEKGLAEFDLEYGVHPERKPLTNITAQSKVSTAKPRVTAYPSLNEDAKWPEGEGWGKEVKERIFQCEEAG